MKSILYIRKKNDVFLQSFIRAFNNKEYQLYILDLMNGEFIDISSNTTDKLANFLHSQNRVLNYLLRYLYGIIFIFKYYKFSVDVCHVLNLKRENFWLIPFFKKRSKKVIVTVYGRTTYLYFSKRVLFSFVYKYVDLLTFSNQALINEFLLSNRNNIKLKIERVIPPIANVVKRNDAFYNINLKKFLFNHSIDDELIKISCSSNLSSYDQHEKVIEAVSKIKNKGRVHLLFLLTYGGNEEKKNNIINKIKENLYDFKVSVFDTFLSNDDLATYRAATDIYINMRSIDQLAGAVIESLFEGALLISGSWLNYETFDRLGIYYKKVKNFEELTECLDLSIENISFYKDNYKKNNIEKIEKEFSLDLTLKKWSNLYDNL